MEPEFSPAAYDPSYGRRTLVVSTVRFLRESLVEILRRTAQPPTCMQAATLAQAIECANASTLGIILLDTAFPGGTRTAARIAVAAPEAKLIAFGISETEEDVLAWAEAGIAGYVPNTASIDELISLIDEIGRGGQTFLRTSRAACCGASRPPAASHPPPLQH
jgi:two-component system nitrate/nitrite response regulator NarL